MSSTGKLLLKGSVLRLVRTASAVLIGFFMMPFLIHQLGAGQYGLWILIGSVLSLFSLLDAGMVGVTQRYIIRAMHGGDDNKVNIAISTSFFLFIGIGLLIALATILLIFIGPLFFDKPDNIPLYQKTIAILGFGLSLSIPMAVFYGIITAKNRFDVLTYISLVALLLQTALVIYFIRNGGDISTLAFITVSITILEKLIVFANSKRFFLPLKIRLHLFSLILIKEYFNYSKWVYLTTIADRIRFTIDDLVVAGVIGLSAVTHYSIAARLISYFGEVLASIFGVITPNLNKYHKLNQWDNLRKAFFTITELATVVSCLIGGLLIVLGANFIDIWIGKDYSDSYIVLTILVVPSVIAHSQRASVAILYAIAKHRYYSIMTTVEAGFNLILSLVLAQYYGIYGIALGTALPLLITKLYLQPRYTCNQIGVRYFDYMKLFIPPVLLSTLFFCIVYYLVQLYPPSNYFSLIASGMIISTFYVTFSLMFLLTPETKSYLSLVLPVRIVSTLKLLKLL